MTDYKKTYYNLSEVKTLSQNYYLSISMWNKLVAYYNTKLHKCIHLMLVNIIKSIT